MNAQLWRVHACAAVAIAVSATAFGSLFQRWTWWPPAAIVAVAIVASAAVTRQRTRAPAAAIGSGLVALIIGIVVTANGITATIPTPSNIRAFAESWRQALTDLHIFALPMPVTPGLTLLITTIVALAALLVVACCAHARTTPLAGIPLLLVYTIPAVLSDEPVLLPSFPISALAYLALVLAAHRSDVGTWGRTVDRRSDASAVNPLRWPGRVFAIVAVVVALAASAAIPGTSGSGWLSGIDLDSWRNQGRAVQAIHPMTQLNGQLTRSEPVELLRVRTDDRDPMYLRVATLDTFTGDGWTQSELRGSAEDRVSAGIDRGRYLAARTPTTPVNSEIEVRALVDSPYLPVYPNPREIDAAGDWRWDTSAETVFSTRTRTAGLTYTVTSARVDYTAAMLRAAGWPQLPRSVRTAAQRFTGLDEHQNRPADDLAKQLVTGSASQYEAVMRINDYFAPENGFGYNLQTQSGSSPDALTNFLNTKEGYCEQYASAMAYLVRAAGIPARVAVGFGGGDFRTSGTDPYLSISSNDAHAWVEVLFPGLGWVPFDPTPAGGAGRTGGLAWAGGPENSAGESAPATTPAPAPATSAAPAPVAAAPNDDAQRSQRSSTAHRNSIWLGVSGVAGVLLLAAIPALLRARQRRHRFAAAAGATTAAANAGWQELLARCTDLGLRAKPSESPRDVERRLTTDIAMDARTREDLSGLRRAYEHAAWGQSSAHQTNLAPVLARVTAAVTESKPRAARIKAAVWPVSLLTRRPQP